MGQRDICLKRYLSNDERFADLINGIMGDGEQLVSAKDLTDMDSQVGYHGGDRVSYRDLLKKAAFGVNFMVIGIENQEHINYLMPLRCLNYDAREYERQAAVEKSKVRRWKKIRGRNQTKDRLTKEEFLSDFRKESRLRPCITIVLYFGENWDGAISLHELLDFSEIPMKLHRFVNDYPMYLVSVRDLQDTSVFQTDLKLVFDCIRHAEDKERFHQNVLENEEYQWLDEDAYDVIARYTKVLGDQEIAAENKMEGGKVNMCKAMQELMADERAEGRCDMIIELLKELGNLPEELVHRIREEKELQVLSRWNRLAARAASIREFERAM